MIYNSDIGKVIFFSQNHQLDWVKVPYHFPAETLSEKNELRGVVFYVNPLDEVTNNLVNF